MADEVFNIAKGKVNAYLERVANNDPANSGITIVLLQSAVADSVMRDYDDLASLLADAGNTEATFTNYTRIDLGNSDVVAPTPDDANDRQDAAIPNQTYVGAGGAVNNNLVKFIICYNPDITADVDANIVPLVHLDFVASTNGGDLSTSFTNTAFFRAA